MGLDLIVRGGTVFDGTGSPGRPADVAIAGDRIVSVGQAEPEADAAEVLDASGLAVAPGFINVLSHSNASVLHDPRSLGELTQGVTTQLFGEGLSMGPLTEEMKQQLVRRLGPLAVPITWTRLSEYMAHVERAGTSQNVASLVGAANPRMCVLGHQARPPEPHELDRMCGLVEEEMADGAFGVGSALIYPPGSFAGTDELIALCRAASRYGGRYFSHLRSEGEALLEALDEFLRVSREAQVPAEIWHLKAIGPDNWPKMPRVLETLEQARERGEPVSADIYPYEAGATSLFSVIPPRYHEGGLDALLARLEDPAVRREIRRALADPGVGWENLYRGAGGASGVQVLAVSEPSLRPYQGRRLSEIAEEEGRDPIDQIFSICLRDRASVDAAFFFISADNLRTLMQRPWISFCSDAAALAPEGRFKQFSTHPRAYGSFTRVLGRWVRDEGILTLEEAIHRMTDMAATAIGLDRRGRVEAGYFADIVVFDPTTIGDRATYEDPHVLSVGVRDVIVNGRLTLRDGGFTGTLAGRALLRR